MRHLTRSIPPPYDALVVPGGRAPEYLRLNTKVLDIVRHFDQANKPIAALCHGPQLLAAAGILKGRMLNAYPPARRRSSWPAAPLSRSTSLTPWSTANLVTGPAWTAHPAWLRKFLDVLEAHLGTAAA
jgi:protease I